MKKILLLVGIVVLLLSTASAQFVTLNPRGQIVGNRFPIIENRAYVQNSVDTLPNSGAINTWYLQSQDNRTLPTLSASSEFALQVIKRDSGYADIYVDVFRNNAYTNVHSFIDSSDVADTLLAALRSPTIDRFSGLIGEPIRIRVSWRNVTQGTMSATYDINALWKP